MQNNTVQMSPIFHKSTISSQRRPSNVLPSGGRRASLRAAEQIDIPLDIMAYLLRQGMDIDRLKHQRINMQLGLHYEVGIVESARSRESDIFIRVRFSEQLSVSTESLMLAEKTRTEEFLVSKETGEVQRKSGGNWIPMLQPLQVLPETQFTKIESAKKRFQYLGILTRVSDGLDDSTKQRIVDEKRERYQKRGAQIANVERFRERISLIMEEAANRRRLIQTYQTTLELAVAYNRSKVFESFQPKTEAVAISGVVREWERQNPFERNLEDVAKKVLEEFAKYQHPSKEKIDEIVGLAAMDNEEINRDVFNVMVKGLAQFKTDSTSLPNPNMVAGFAKMIRLLPPTFLSEGYVEKVMVIIQNLGEWLENPNRQFNAEGKRRDEMLHVFHILKQLLDGLVDNRQLQIMDQQNRYFTGQKKDSAQKLTVEISNPMHHTDHPIQQNRSEDNGLPIAELVGQLRETLTEQSLDVQEEVSETSMMDMTTLVASSFGDVSGSTSSLGDYLKERIGGSGIEPEQRDAIKGVFEGFMSHSDPDVRCLASYCSEALARIPVRGESDIAEFGKRGMHLILGAKSLALIVTSQGTAIGEYAKLAEHLKGALQDSRMSRNDWYDTARRLDSVISEAHHDPDKHHMLLDIIATTVINSNEAVSWELVKMCLSSIHDAIVSNGNKNNQMMYTRMLAQLFMNPIYVQEKETRQLALVFLIQSASDADEVVRELAKMQLQGLMASYSQKKSWGMYTTGAKLVHKLPNVQTLGIQDARVVEEDRQDHALLKKAKETAFPIEDKLGKLRQAVEQFRMKTPIDEELASYVPLKGARSKEDAEEKNWFMLQQRVDEFVNRDNRRRDRDGVLLNVKGERIVDAQNRPVTKGFHRDAVAEPEVLLIHGQAGAGKSLFSRYIEREYWDRYQSGGVVPLFISLPALQDPFHHGIEQALAANGFSPDQIQQLKAETNPRSGEVVEVLMPERDETGAFKKEGDISRDNRWGVKCEVKSSNPPRLLVILDGYDEIQTQINLYQAYGLGNWKDLKVIISARTEYLEQMGSYTTFFKPEKGTLSEVFIRPFDVSQQETFVRQILAKKQSAGESNVLESEQNLFNPTAYMSFIKEANLSDFIEHPFMLKIIVDILPVLKEKKDKEKALGLGSDNVSRFEVYELFLNQWFERESDRIRRRHDVPEGYQPVNSLWEYSTAVACFMYTNKRQTIQGNPPSFSKIKATEADGAHFLTDEPKVKLSKLGAPIKKMGAASYAFVHKSIQEFFVARQILDEFITAYEEAKPLDTDTILNQRHIQEDPSVMRFVLDNMSDKTIAALEAVVMQSRQTPTKQDQRPAKSPIAIASANAISLMACRSDLRPFYRTDLSNIQIPGARLDGGYFKEVNFRGADMSEVSARQTMFEGCDWSGAVVNGIKFGEFPKIDFGSAITSAAYSPDGKTLATGSDDKTIRLWDVKTGQQIREPFQAHEEYISSLVYSPDGTLLATGSWDHTARLWDVSTGQPVGEPLRGHESEVHRAVFSPDGKTLATGSADKTIRLWNVETGQPIDELFLGHEGEVVTVVFSPDGKTLATGSTDKTIRLWDVGTRQPIGEPLMGHSDMVWSVVYSPDGKILATGSNDIRLWDVGTRQPIGEPLEGHEGCVSRIAYRPDGKTLVTGGDDLTIRLWNVETRQPIGEPLRGHNGLVSCVIFSPDGKTLVTGSNDIRLWDVEADPPIGEPLQGHEGKIESVVFSPDGKTLATGSEDKTIRLWDVETGQLLGEPLRGHEVTVNSVIFSPDGKTLATGSEDLTIRLWDVGTGQPLGTLQGHRRGICTVAFSSDGKTLASGGRDERIQLWDTVTRRPIGGPLGEEDSVVISNLNTPRLSENRIDSLLRPSFPARQTVRKQSGTINSVVYSPDGQTLASAGGDTIQLWDVATRRSIGEPLQGYEGNVNSVVYSPDGQILASGSDYKVIRLWDLKTRQPIGNLLEGHEDVVSSVAFSPDGKMLASGSKDGSIRLWATETGQAIGDPLWGHEGGVLGVAFNPNGKSLATGGEDNTVRLWDISNPKQPLMRRILGKRTQVLNLSRVLVSEAVGFSDLNRRLIEDRNDNFLEVRIAAGRFLSLVGFDIDLPGEESLWGVVADQRLETSEGIYRQLTIQDTSTNQKTMIISNELFSIDEETVDPEEIRVRYKIKATKEVSVSRGDATMSVPLDITMLQIAERLKGLEARFGDVDFLTQRHDQNVLEISQKIDEIKGLLAHTEG